MATICLNMIVRNEAAIIGRCLESVRPILRYWVIVDTGSEDGTPELIRSLLDGIPGELHHRPWRHFEHNRNQALELARSKADYLLFADADMELVIEEGFRPEQLTADSYLLEQTSPALSYHNVRLVRGDLPYRYEGVTHEVLRTEAGRPPETLSTLRFLDHGDGGSKQDKFIRDIQLLGDALEQSPDHPRTTFYLAQSLRDVGELQDARVLYERRVELGGWEEERWYARYQVARMMERGGHPWPDVAAAYLLAWEERPHRAEPLYWLAHHHRMVGQHYTGYLFARQGVETAWPEGDLLFIDRPVYTWKLLDEYAVCCYWTGRKPECRRACEQLLASGELPVSERERVTGNRDLCD